jgi:hypothetical protein
MATVHKTHESHEHVHGDCEHPAVKHAGHVDYLHDGHLHSIHGDHVDEHAITVDDANPDVCTKGHDCAAHEATHAHSASCGHPAVPHGEHTDYLVAGHIHHPHAGHCDNHGKLTFA